MTVWRTRVPLLGIIPITMPCILPVFSSHPLPTELILMSLTIKVKITILIQQGQQIKLMVLSYISPSRRKTCFKDMALAMALKPKG